MAEKKKFARQPVEPRGEQPNEIRMQKTFWRKYSMDLVMTLDKEELEALLDKFFTGFEEAQKKNKPNWWYPEDPMSIALKRNKTKTESKYKSTPFNPRIDSKRNK